MRNKFTTLLVEIPATELTSLQIERPTKLLVLVQVVWLTHSASNLDYVLHQGDEVEMLPGLVLLESAKGGPARVRLEEEGLTARQSPVAWLARLTNLGALARYASHLALPTWLHTMAGSDRQNRAVRCLNA